MREKRRGDKSESSNFKEDWQILKGWAGVPYSELWRPYTTDRDPIMDLTLASKIHRRTRIWLLTGCSKTSSVKFALVYPIGLLACAVNPYSDTHGPH